MKASFPTVRMPDGDGGYVEMYKCYKHGLLFATEDLASIHYAVDHIGKNKRRSGYRMEGGE